MEVVRLPIESAIVRIVSAGAGCWSQDAGLVAVLVVPDSRSWEGTLYCRVVYTGAGVSTSGIT